MNDVKVSGFTLRDAERLLAAQAVSFSPQIHLAIVDAGLQLLLLAFLHIALPGFYVN